MKNLSSMHGWRLAALALAVGGVVAGCGGSSGTPLLGGGATVDPSTGQVVSKPTLALSLSTTTVSASGPATVTAVVKDAAGNAVAGEVVTFSTEGGLGTFNPASALTDASGKAVVLLQPANAATAGADRIVATAKLGSETVTAAQGFQTTATDVTIASFTSDVANLAAQGQTTLTVKLNTATGAPVGVTLSSTCVNEGRATLTPTTQSTSSGVAMFTYNDKGCGAFKTTDTVQASLAGTAQTQSLTLNLASPAVTSLAFVSASPNAIFLRGSGEAESSEVKFQVRDARGNGLPNVPVDFSLSTTAGGVRLDTGSVSGQPTRTDINGVVSVLVLSGTVPTPVRVVASVATPSGTVSTVSSSLSIGVGLPAQNQFSLSQQTMNIEGLLVDGVENAYTTIISDRLGNPVPANTAVNFVSTSGQIAARAYTVTGADGLSRATARFQSSQPRPANGRISVLAYAVGEESFLDINGNNVRDAGEPWRDLGDPYLDRAFNGIYESAVDQYFPLTNPGPTGACTEPSSSAALLPAGWGIPSRPNTCDGVWGRAYVRGAVQTVLSSSTVRPVFDWLPSTAMKSGVTSCAITIGRSLNDELLFDSAGAVTARQVFPVGSWPISVSQQGNVGVAELQGVGANGSVSFLVADNNPEALNPAPAGTKISVRTTEGLAAQVAGGSPVPSTLSPSRATVSFNFTDNASVGTLTLVFETPRGVVTAVPLRLNRDPVAGAVACP